jgi:hypothetical protein
LRARRRVARGDTRQEFLARGRIGRNRRGSAQQKPGDRVKPGKLGSTRFAARRQMSFVRGSIVGRQGACQVQSGKFGRIAE